MIESLLSSALISWAFSTWGAPAVIAITAAIAAITFGLYVAAMRLKTKRDRGELKLFHYPWAVIVLGIGFPFDFVINILVGLAGGELPRWQDDEWLLTARLDRWARDAEHPRRAGFAQRMCKLLNKHDEDHCYAGGE